MLKDLTLDELLELVEGVADIKRDGHLTLMRFTTGWKAFYGTPHIDANFGELSDYQTIWRMATAKSLPDALIACIKNDADIDGENGR